MLSCTTKTIHSLWFCVILLKLPKRLSMCAHHHYFICKPYFVRFLILKIFFVCLRGGSIYIWQFPWIRDFILVIHAFEYSTSYLTRSIFQFQFVFYVVYRLIHPLWDVRRRGSLVLSIITIFEIESENHIPPGLIYTFENVINWRTLFPKGVLYFVYCYTIVHCYTIPYHMILHL